VSGSSLPKGVYSGVNKPAGVCGRGVSVALDSLVTIKTNCGPRPFPITSAEAKVMQVEVGGGLLRRLRGGMGKIYTRSKLQAGESISIVGIACGHSHLVAIDTSDKGDLGRGLKADLRA
jgi:hypothetical protein